MYFGDGHRTGLGRIWCSLGLALEKKPHRGHPNALRRSRLMEQRGTRVNIRVTTAEETPPKPPD